MDERVATTAQRLKQIMDMRQLRQVDILRAAEPYCRELGVKLNKNDLSQYVSGKVTPGQDKLTILGHALNVSEAWLMGYDVPMSKSHGLKIRKDMWASDKKRELTISLDTWLVFAMKQAAEKDGRTLEDEIEDVLYWYVINLIDEETEEG